MASWCPWSAVFISFGVVVSLFCLLLFLTIPSQTSPPEFGHGWWGEGEERPDDSIVYKTDISISDSVLQDLQQRLSKTRFFSPLEDVQWQYGTNANYMKELVEYWRTKFEWRKQEELLNSVPNYHTQIEGLKVHFWHLKPNVRKGQKRVSVMFIHGWPGSYFEFYKVIQILKSASESGDYAYEVVCPAIPGYGFSEAPHKPGFEVLGAARVFAKLMARLGIESYYVQGGDFGAGISHAMAVIDKSHVRGLHQNLFAVPAPYGPLSYLIGYLTFSAEDHRKVFPLKEHIFYLLRETGYFLLQATRPDTVGLGLNDSPAGLAAYIIEKFSVWSGCKTDDSHVCLESRFTKDELLTNVMIYWVTNSITSSMRLCKEALQSPKGRQNYGIPVDVPSALAESPHEIIQSPKPWLAPVFRDLVQYSRFHRGGHFAAFEEPEMLATDVMEFFKKVETRKTMKAEL